MSLDVRLNLKMQQRLVMTPNLQQAIKLLQLSRLELEQHISQEMMENPMLEALDMMDSPDELEDRDDEKPKESDTPDEKTLHDEMEWERYFDNGTDMGHLPSEAQGPVLYENFLKRAETLEEHLIWQLQMSDLSDQDRAVGYLLIGNIENDGYLHEDLQELAEFEGVPFADMERVLQKIQREFDPIAIGSRNLQECLTVQLEHYGHADPLLYDLVEHHLELLQRKQFQELGRKLKCDMERLKPAIEIIEHLEPKPGRKFADQPTQYVVPDVYIVKVDGEYQIVTNDDGIPRLKVSNLYKSILTSTEKTAASMNGKGAEASETKDYLEKKMRSALWLIKSVDQRQRTIYRVTESILRKQREFFDKGVRHLKPLVLRDVAEDIGVHESTVSRVSTNKYLHCAQGVFELKFFFHSGISSGAGEDVSSLRIKEIIKEEIANENPRKPLSDQKLANILQQRLNVDIARRTVAKYRIDLGIESSSKRKSL